MSKIENLLEDTWYEYQGQISLDWMEQEYFHYISKLKKQNKHDKPEKQEEIPCGEGQRPYIFFTQKDDPRD